MKTRHTLFLASAMATSAVIALPAAAYETGDLIVRAGIAQVSPDDSSSEVHINGVSVPGSSVSVGDDTQLGITAVYMLNEKWGIELLASTPFTHEIDSNLGASVGEATHLPPTVSGQFFPMGTSGGFKPYLGLGINYTIFFDEELSSAFENAIGTGSIDLDDSIGLAFEIGADFQLNENWMINASIWKAMIDTTATINLDAGPQVSVDVDIDPMVYMLSLGYKF